MKTVGERAGVSAMTVSRALKNPASVSKAVYERIKAVVDEVGYVPNLVAGSLSSDRGTQVALIVPSLRTAIHAEMIQGISDTLRQRNYQLMISDCGNSMDIEETLIRAYVSQRVCGVILHNTKHSEGALKVLANAGIPVVETGDLKKTPIDCAVSYSNYAAGQAMAKHFAARGYKSMAFVSLPVENRDRIAATRRGYVAGLRKEGVEVAENQLVEVGIGLENGAKALHQVLTQAPQTEAIFFAGDVLAAGALFECQRKGIKVPRRIALANSDDAELFAHTSPMLTSIRYPRYEIGVQAAQVVLDRVQNPEAEPVIRDVGFTVVQRESS